MARRYMGLLVATMSMVIASHGFEVDSPHQGEAVLEAGPKHAVQHVNVYSGPNCGHRSQTFTTADVTASEDEATRSSSTITHRREGAPIKKLATSCAWHLEHAIIGRKTKRKLEFSSRVCKGKLEVEKALFRSDGKPEGDKAVILSEALTPGQCVTPFSTAFPKMRAACRSAKIHCPQFEDESLTSLTSGGKTSDPSESGLVGDALDELLIQGARAQNSSSTPTRRRRCTVTTAFGYTNCGSSSTIPNESDAGDLNTWIVFKSPTVELICYGPCTQGTDYCTAARHFPSLRLSPNKEEIELQFKVTCSACDSCRIYIRAKTQYGNVPLSGWNGKDFSGCLDAYSQLEQVFSETKDDIHNSCRRL